jgi:phage gpG-like protein
MISAAIIGEAELVAKIGRISPSVRQQLRETVERLSIKLSAKVKNDKLSGQVLNVRTGRLRRSINYRLSEAGNGVYATVGTNVEYAKYHEYEHTVRGKIYPARSFLRSSLADLKAEITQELAASVRRAAQETMKT